MRALGYLMVVGIGLLIAATTATYIGKAIAASLNKSTALIARGGR
jgi:hypothetical protein